MMITTYNVPRINGGASAETITRAVKPSLGVSDVMVNIPARLVQVEYDEDATTAVALKDVIEAAGYPVQRYSDGKR